MPIEDYNFDEYLKSSLNKGTGEQPSELLWKRLNDQLKRNDVQHRNFMRLSITVVSLSCLAVLVLVLAWNRTDSTQKVSENFKSSTVEQNVKTASDSQKIKGTEKQFDTNKDKSLDRQNAENNFSTSTKEKHFVASENSLQSSITEQYRQSIKENEVVAKNFKPSGTTQDIKSTETTQDVKSNATIQDFKSNEVNQDYSSNEVSQEIKTSINEQLKYLKASWKPQELAFVKVYHRPQKTFTQWAVRLDLNPGISVMKMEDGGANSPYNASYFEQNQLSSLVPNANLNIRYHAPKGLTFSAGIGVSSIVTNFDSPNSSIHFDSTHHQFEFETANGHMQVHQDEFEGEDEQPWGPGEPGEPWEPGQNPPPNFHVRLQEKEVYTMLQVPVQLGYEFHFKRLKLFAQTGMIFSKTIYEKSEIRLNENHALREENDLDYNGIFFSHSLELGAEFRLTPHLGLSVSPNFRYFITPLNPGAERLIYPRKYGLNVGLSYYFK